MKEYIVTYKYISKMFREKNRTFSFLYNEDLRTEEGNIVPLSVQLINEMYRDLSSTYDVDRTDGMSISVSTIWRVEEGDIYAC